MAMADVKKVKSVTRYEPGPLPESVEDLGIYVITEFKRLGNIQGICGLITSGLSKKEILVG